MDARSHVEPKTHVLTCASVFVLGMVVVPVLVVAAVPVMVPTLTPLRYMVIVLPKPMTARWL